jgi:F-type H+-transporting ATPase subunit epsilon
MTLRVQLVSPEQVLFEGDADMVVVRTLGGGDIAFLTGHAAFLGALDIWPVRVITDNGEIAFACHGGFVQVDGHKVVILSDVSELQAQIDVVRAEAALARADAALASDPEDLAWQAAKKRAEVRLMVARVTV